MKNTEEQIGNHQMEAALDMEATASSQLQGRDGRDYMWGWGSLVFFVGGNTKLMISKILPNTFKNYKISFFYNKSRRKSICFFFYFIRLPPPIS